MAFSVTAFEKTKIIGARAEQIAKGATPIIDPKHYGVEKSVDIAKLEYTYGVIPIVLHRNMPDGRIVVIKFKPQKCVLLNGPESKGSKGGKGTGRNVRFKEPSEEGSEDEPSEDEPSEDEPSEDEPKQIEPKRKKKTLGKN